MIRQLCFILLFCFLSQISSIVSIDVDEATGCPKGVTDHVCTEGCAEDTDHLGCWCDDVGKVTASIYTPCTIENPDPCKDNTKCQNGGVCVPNGITEFKCECAGRFGGEFCEDPLPTCGDYHCGNAQCIQTDDPKLPVYCLCGDGTRKDPKLNVQCPPSPCFKYNTSESVCENSGQCYTFGTGYLCNCTEGWAGQNCTLALSAPYCNGAVCGEGVCRQSPRNPKYTCDCGAHPSTFAAALVDLVRCEKSPCYGTPNVCQNGGTCSNLKEGKFLCTCQARYTGVKCERQSPCYNNPCLNGGVCQMFNETKYVCKCQPYFAGEICQIAQPDPCKGISCGQFGKCADIKGQAMCDCFDGMHPVPSTCASPCTKFDCGLGACVPKGKEATCSCPVNRKGPRCEQSRDICRQSAVCAGGYCKPDWQKDVNTLSGFACYCQGSGWQETSCPLPKECPLDCGMDGVCVETDGIQLPGLKPIYYVCSCSGGYISTTSCADVANKVVTAKCGANGTPYPSRNPHSPIGCWCNNGTHIEVASGDPELNCP